MLSQFATILAHSIELSPMITPFVNTGSMKTISETDDRLVDC